VTYYIYKVTELTCHSVIIQHFAVNLRISNHTGQFLYSAVSRDCGFMLVAPSFVVHCAGHQMQHLFVIYCDYTQDLGEYV